ncbi:MAG TPA: hypothetical protein VEK33_23990 [Terriglobales bacterium]|nr:hypothetical protein [Terriglobales bacterium]
MKFAKVFSWALGPGLEGRHFLLSPASLSALSYEHDLFPSRDPAVE